MTDTEVSTRHDMIGRLGVLLLVVVIVSILERGVRALETIASAAARETVPDAGQGSMPALALDRAPERAMRSSAGRSDNGRKRAGGERFTDRLPVVERSETTEPDGPADTLG